MAQMGVKTTTIAEADVMLERETDPLINDRPATGKSSRGEAKPSPPLPAGGQDIIWTNVVIITVLHVLAVKVFFSYIFSLQFKTLVWGEYKRGIRIGVGYARIKSVFRPTTPGVGRAQTIKSVRKLRHPLFRPKPRTSAKFLSQRFCHVHGPTVTRDTEADDRPEDFRLTVEYF